MHQIAEIGREVSREVIHASHDIGRKAMYIEPRFTRVVLPEVPSQKQKSKFFIISSFVTRILKGRPSSAANVVKQTVNESAKPVSSVTNDTVRSNPFAAKSQALESMTGYIDPFISTNKNQLLSKAQMEEKVKDLTHEQIVEPVKARMAEIRKSQQALNNTVKEKTGTDFYDLLKLHDSDVPEKKGLHKYAVQGSEIEWNKAYTAHRHHEFLGNLIPAIEDKKISKYAGYALDNVSASIHPLNGYKDLPKLEEQLQKEMKGASKTFKTSLPGAGTRTSKESLLTAEERLIEIIKSQQALNNTIKEKTGEKFTTLLRLQDSEVQSDKEKFSALTKGHEEDWNKAHTAHLHHEFLGNLIPVIREKKLSAANRQFLFSKSATLDPVNGYKELPKLQRKLDQINLSPEAKLEEVRKGQQKLNTIVEKKTGLNFYKLLNLHNSNEKEFADTVNSRGKQRAWKEAYTAHLHHEFLGGLVFAIEGKKLTKTNQNFLVKRSANLNAVNGYRELPKLQERLNQVNLTPAQRLEGIRKSQQALNNTIKEKTGEKFTTLLKLHDSNNMEEKAKFESLTQKHKNDWNKAYTAHLHHEFLGSFAPAIEEGRISKYNQRVLNKKSGNISMDTGYKWLPKLQEKLDKLLKEEAQPPIRQDNYAVLTKRIANITKKQTELNKLLHQETGRSFYEMLRMHKSQEPEVKDAFNRLTDTKEKKRAWDKAYTAHLYRDFLGKLSGGIERGNINNQIANKLVNDSGKVDPVRGYMQVPVLEVHLNRSMTNPLSR